jgi:hypothetical protein
VFGSVGFEVEALAHADKSVHNLCTPAPVLAETGMIILATPKAVPRSFLTRCAGSERVGYRAIKSSSIALMLCATAVELRRSHLVSTTFHSIPTCSEERKEGSVLVISYSQSIQYSSLAVRQLFH